MLTPMCGGLIRANVFKEEVMVCSFLNIEVSQIVEGYTEAI